MTFNVIMRLPRLVIGSFSPKKQSQNQSQLVRAGFPRFEQITYEDIG